MGRRTRIVPTDRRHSFSRQEAERTGLPLAELVRRAVDHAYRPGTRTTVEGYEVRLALWRAPDAAVAGRRRGPM